jgi:hypothetical protein
VASANELFRLKRRRKSTNIRQHSQYTDPDLDLITLSGPGLTYVQFKGATCASPHSSKEGGGKQENGEITWKDLERT